MRFLLLFLFSVSVAAAPVKTPQAEAELVAETTALVPGEPTTVALRLKAIPGWHTYWRNPGDSGEPTRIEWQLPAGFAAGDIEWPVPERIAVGPLMNFGYHGEVLLLTRVVAPRDVDLKPVVLKARAHWLVCEVQCIPESADLSVTLPVARTAAADPAWAPTIAATRARIPAAAPAGWRFDAREEEGGATLAITVPQGVALKDAFFLPFAEGKIEPAAQQTLTRKGSDYRLSLRAAAQPVGPLSSLDGILVHQDRAFQVNAPLSARFADLGLAVALAFAFAGGLLLNLMPCVLPVLSIKVLGFAQGHARLRDAWLYVAGVLVSFWLLAGLLVGLRALGQQLGWGFQLQSPIAVAVLAAFFLLLALNLSGVFELRLSMAGGSSGHFLSGVLAVVVASPCTAPFMGAALGYAVLESGWRAFAVFTALGLGMALPYAVLASAPAARRWLPRPGPWMPRLKQWLAVPLYATVLWLGWVLVQQVGSPAALHDDAWQPWSEQRIVELSGAGRPVFVDFTAAWCVTCQVNERVVLGRADMKDAFRQRNVALLRADWTKRDPKIARALAALGRSGVPVYVVYRPGQAPVVLPEILTRERVLAALDG
ncbi:MAG TPA: thioredoxin family protein [Burkholderiales bacterium]|nr:thioredoxin family protein [Burkholderiales bacterium]